MVMLRVMILRVHSYIHFSQASLHKDACHLSRLLYKLIQTFTVNYNIKTAKNAKLGQMWV